MADTFGWRVTFALVSVLTAVLMATLWLGEHIGVLQALGIALIVAAAAANAVLRPASKRMPL